MSDVRPQAADPKSQIFGTTARAWVELYQRNPKAKELPLSVATKATALGVRQSQVLTTLTTPNRLEYSQGAIESNLTQLAAAGTKEKRDAHTKYQTKYGELKGTIARLTAQQAELLKQYYGVLGKQSSSLEELIDRYLKKEISQEVLLKNVNDLKQEFKDFTKRVNSHVQELSTLQRDLDSLHNQIYADIPPEKQPMAVAPKVPEEEIRFRPS